MEKNVAFSFIMPAYKARFLHKAIDSILKQSYTNFELVIVDDDSPENLSEVIGLFHDSRIKYEINEKNIGGHDLVSNWNHCIQYAQNEFIILATDDDIFEPLFLSEAIFLISKYPDVNIIRSGVQKIDENENVLDIEFPLKEYMTSREFALDYAKGATISCVSNYIFRKEALINNGGFISFPKAHYSDDATVLALSLNGIACMNSNYFKFRVSSINLSNRGDLMIVKEQLKATELYMEWYLHHIKEFDIYPGDYFERACYGRYKSKYISMIDVLVSKIPLSRIGIVYKAIFLNKYLFRKEKYRLFSSYLIERI